MWTYKKNTWRKTLPKEEFERAWQQVIFDKKSMISTAKEFSIPYKSLAAHVTKLKKILRKNPALTRSQSIMESALCSRNNQIFNYIEENALESYLKKAADIYYGFTAREVRMFAYEFAKKNNVTIPELWDKKKIATKNWLGSYLKRHPVIVIRQDKSIVHNTLFDKCDVNMFFDYLKIAYRSLNLSPGSIWNADETGLMIPPATNRVIARRVYKNIKNISTDEGTLVSVAVAISAHGSIIPPFFGFPRVQYKQQFLSGGPVGCDGDANPNGWMNENNFKKFARHFVKYVKPSKDKPVLLLIGNNDSHLSIEVLEYFGENGVTILSFPPQYNNKLQPLDRSVFGLLKIYFNNACDKWITEKQESTSKLVTMYDIPELVKTSLPLAATINNIKSGFQITGISPLNRDVFIHSEFSTDISDGPSQESSTVNHNELILETDSSS